MTIHDYFQIYFYDGSILNIFNRIRTPAIDSYFLEGLAHDTILEDAAGSDSMILRFDTGKSIEIGFADADYRGPEALELIEPDGRRIVWS